MAWYRRKASKFAYIALPNYCLLSFTLWWLLLQVSVCACVTIDCIIVVLFGHVVICMLQSRGIITLWRSNLWFIYLWFMIWGFCFCEGFDWLKGKYLRCVHVKWKGKIPGVDIDRTVHCKRGVLVWLLCIEIIDFIIINVWNWRVRRVPKKEAGIGQGQWLTTCSEG